jgi:hypothetical protein
MFDPYSDNYVPSPNSYVFLQEQAKEELSLPPYIGLPKSPPSSPMCDRKQGFLRNRIMVRGKLHKITKIGEEAASIV